MLKYKDTYFVIKQNPENKDDTYIKCKKNVQIYRYDKDTLCIQFNSNKYANARIKGLADVGVYLTSFQRGDDEQTYTFPESKLNIVADLIKAKQRIKRELTEEQREAVRIRLQNARQLKNNSL